MSHIRLATKYLCQSQAPARQLAQSAKAGAYVPGILVKNGDLVILAEEFKCRDNWDKIITGPPGFRTDSTPGAWRLGAETHALRGTLLDSSFEEMKIGRVGVKKEILAQIFLREMWVRFDETVKRTAAMTYYDLEFGETIKDIAMRQ